MQHNTKTSPLTATSDLEDVSLRLQNHRQGWLAGSWRLPSRKLPSDAFTRMEAGNI